MLRQPLYDLGTAQFAELLARQGPSSYSFPEYQSRSVMTLGADYIVTYDDVFNDAVAHRFSWFTGVDDDMPFVHLVRGGLREGRYEHPAKVETPEVRGIWRDGTGDAMAVVTHKPGLKVEPAPFGCLVEQAQGRDWIFRDPGGVAYSRDGVAFEGSAGAVRRRGGEAWELALFQGRRIAGGGLSLSVKGNELGISARFSDPGEVSGVYFSPEGGTLTLECSHCGGAGFYVDGRRRDAKPVADGLIVELLPGHHRWQLTRRLPEPNAPVVARTVNAAGRTTVIWDAVAGADSYRIQLSDDNAATWREAGRTPETSYDVTGLRNGAKYHVRLVAMNRERESAPGPEYPVYASADPPAYPDGLRLRVGESRVEASWGEVLGAGEYRLYRRPAGATEFEQVYAGRSTEFAESLPGVVRAFERPGMKANALRENTAYRVCEYAVTSVNGNGESTKSPVATTAPASWVNWDPKPGEPFRRRFTYNTTDYLRLGDEGDYPRYYPR